MSKTDECITQRKKTDKQVNFMLNDIAKGIIDKYASPFWDDDDYIFPILNVQTHKTEQQRHDRIHKLLKKVNRELRKIGLVFVNRTEEHHNTLTQSSFQSIANNTIQNRAILEHNVLGNGLDI
jgi:hypothetical protein